MIIDDAMLFRAWYLGAVQDIEQQRENRIMEMSQLRSLDSDDTFRFLNATDHGVDDLLLETRNKLRSGDEIDDCHFAVRLIDAIQQRKRQEAKQFGRRIEGFGIGRVIAKIVLGFFGTSDSYQTLFDIDEPAKDVVRMMTETAINDAKSNQASPPEAISDLESQLRKLSEQQ
ncbi:MAG: hypothetical protein KDB00_22970 [Planctomycetales bacterium]|nr:hypothetical protein [Planctomycetales bacterium]